MNSAAQYRNLLSPLRIGPFTLRNRFVMGSMHTMLENLPDGVARQTAFYRDRAKGGAALIITGGYSPNSEGRTEEGAPVLDNLDLARALAPLPQAVHTEGGLMLLQILHAGRYARHDAPVGASSISSPISKAPPRSLEHAEVEKTIEDFVNCATLAAEAGFDGIEVMGSEGYLINQFTAARTNTRNDKWGGSVENRLRMPVEIVRRIRKRLPTNFLIMYRISAIDLVEGGCTTEEILLQAKSVEAAGADILNTGIGWHEAAIPTIAYFVPRGAWRSATARLKKAVSIPVVASNRINMPGLAEEILTSGEADLISMARPFLADAELPKKTAEGRVDEINTCIACNQACLDFIFRGKPATCLVNPRAGRELEFDDLAKQANSKRIAVVGAGAAGLAFAVNAAGRGHKIVLYEASKEIGGQLNYAMQIPSKQEFRELKRYFAKQIQVRDIELKLGTRATREQLSEYDHIVIATGVLPRIPEIVGIDHPKVVSYPEVLSGKVSLGKRVAIIGAGGIGFDVAAYILHSRQGPDAKEELAAFNGEWGIDLDQNGGLGSSTTVPTDREVYLLQRSAGKIGITLAPSTGWILKKSLFHHGLKTFGSCRYLRIDDQGFHIEVHSAPRLLAVDNVVICAGQISDRSLYDELKDSERPVHIIGGADVAAELDARRAIDQATRLALSF